MVILLRNKEKARRVCWTDQEDLDLIGDVLTLESWPEVIHEELAQLLACTHLRASVKIYPRTILSTPGT